MDGEAVLLGVSDVDAVLLPVLDAEGVSGGVGSAVCVALADAPTLPVFEGEGLLDGVPLELLEGVAEGDADDEGRTGAQLRAAYARLGALGSDSSVALAVPVVASHASSALQYWKLVTTAEHDVEWYVRA